MRKLYITFISIITAFTLSTSVFAYTPDVYWYDGEYYTDDEIVTVIVELEDEPVLVSEESSLFGTAFMFSAEGQELEQNILSMQSSVLEDMEDSIDISLEPKYTYTSVLNGFSVDVPKNQIEEIKKLDNVKAVHISYPVQLHLSTAIPQTNSLPSQTATEAVPSGYTGKNQVIAIIDDEFETSHSFLKGKPTNPKYTKADIVSKLKNAESTNVLSTHFENVYISEKVPFAYNYADTQNGTTIKSGLSYHGTHVAGIAAGKLATVPDSSSGIPNDFSGVAPDAQLVLMRTVNDSGELNTDAVIAALNDAAILGVDVINLSLGADYVSPSADTVYTNVLDKLEELGIAVCASAGNLSYGFSAGDKQTGYTQLPVPVTNPDYSAIGSPAGYSSATAVASVSNTHIFDGANSTEHSEAGKISTYSSWGVNETLELKPEISAPGDEIYSSILNDSYGSDSGTSMASPHIAGVYALMYEFFDKNYPDMAATERTQKIENMLMSTANIVVQNDDGETPYSPRVQGAGLVNTAAAMNTPAILVGNERDSYKSKISLGEISDTFTISFDIQNLTDNPIEYKLSLELMIDSSDGEYFDGNSKRLSYSTEMPSTVTTTGSTTSVSFSVTPNTDELASQKAIFENGFFIDGFVRLINQTNEQSPELSIPFTGFYGDWTAPSTLDSTMYDQGGSSLYVNGKCQGTVAITSLGNNPIPIGAINNVYDKNRIAISPNGDGLCEYIGIGAYHLRTINERTISLLNSSGDIVLSGNSNNIVPKFTNSSITFTAEYMQGLAEGEYTLKYQTRLNYENAEVDELTLPVVVDKQCPEFVDIDLSDLSENKKLLTIKAYDNHQIDYILFTLDGKLYDVYHVPTDIGKVSVTEFQIPDDIKDSLKIDVVDCARNGTSVYLKNALDKIIPSAMTTRGDLISSGNMDFKFVNTDNDDLQGDILFAVYDSFDTLISSASSKNVTLPKDQSTELKFSNLKNLNSMSYFKLFIWDSLSGLKPLDTVKIFN